MQPDVVWFSRHPWDFVYQRGDHDAIARAAALASEYRRGVGAHGQRWRDRRPAIGDRPSAIGHRRIMGWKASASEPPVRVSGKASTGRETHSEAPARGAVTEDPGCAFVDRAAACGLPPCCSWLCSPSSPWWSGWSSSTSDARRATRRATRSGPLRGLLRS